MKPEDFIHLIPLLPTIRGDVKNDTLYCLYCIDNDKIGMGGWRNELSVGYHLKTKHDVAEGNAVAGEDYIVGFRMKQLLAALTVFADGAASRFERHLATVDTVEDFLLDCGDEPWPALGMDE